MSERYKQPGTYID